MAGIAAGSSRPRANAVAEGSPERRSTRNDVSRQTAMGPLADGRAVSEAFDPVPDCTEILRGKGLPCAGVLHQGRLLHLEEAGNRIAEALPGPPLGSQLPVDPIAQRYRLETHRSVYGLCVDKPCVTREETAG